MRRQSIVALLLLVACASTTPVVASEQLYFAIELRREGNVLGTPKLLGETGKTIRAERRKPGASVPDYKLTLVPKIDGDHYEIVLDVAVPEASGHTELEILHGQVRSLELGQKPGQLQVSLLVMRVDSPEFRALMELSKPDDGLSPHI